jgi:ribonuclease HII
MFAVAAMFDVSIRDEGGWLTKNSPIEGVNDSKKFSTHAKRTEVFHRILRSPLLVDFGIGHVTVEEIDQHGIDEANRIAFYRAWSTLKPEPQYMLVDGDRPAPAWNYSQQKNRPKGDGYWWPVGAASILAKVIRDNYMVDLGLDHLHFKWAQNAGYGTKDHTDAIKHFGACELHRKSFVKKMVGRAA